MKALKIDYGYFANHGALSLTNLYLSCQLFSTCYKLPCLGSVWDVWKLIFMSVYSLQGFSKGIFIFSKEFKKRKIVKYVNYIVLLLQRYFQKFQQKIRHPIWITGLSIGFQIKRCYVIVTILFLSPFLKPQIPGVLKHPQHPQHPL